MNEHPDAQDRLYVRGLLAEAGIAESPELVEHLLALRASSRTAVPEPVGELAALLEGTPVQLRPRAKRGRGIVLGTALVGAMAVGAGAVAANPDFLVKADPAPEVSFILEAPRPERAVPAEAADPVAPSPAAVPDPEPVAETVPAPVPDPVNMSAGAPEPAAIPVPAVAPASPPVPGSGGAEGKAPVQEPPSDHVLPEGRGSGARGPELPKPELPKPEVRMPDARHSQGAGPNVSGGREQRGGPGWDIGRGNPHQDGRANPHQDGRGNPHQDGRANPHQDGRGNPHQDGSGPPGRGR